MTGSSAVASKPPSLKTGSDSTQPAPPTAPAGSPPTLHRVPWQVWVVVALLALECLSNLFDITSQPLALLWVAAKALMITGLLRRWRAIYIMALLVIGVHIVYFTLLSPVAAILNQAMMVLLLFARRHYFDGSVTEVSDRESGRQGLSPGRLLWLIGIGVAAALLVLPMAGWLFQVVEQARQRQSEMVRLTALQHAHSEAQRQQRNQSVPKQTNASFGPVIERVLIDVNEPGTNKAIRFRTGELASPLAGGGAVITEWMLENRMDLVVSWRSNQWQLITAGLRLRDISPGSWENANKASVRNALSQFPFLTHPGELETTDRTYLMPEDTKLPWTLAFETTERDRGLLQILGFTDNPRGVKIRYKLVQTESTELRAAKAALAELRLKYTDEHPTVLGLGARIKGMEELQAAKAMLAELRLKFTDEHPQVQALKARIKAMEEK